MACPTDLELERPHNLMEMVSGDMSWGEFGFRIKWTEPKVPSDHSMSLGEPLRLRVAVEAKKDVSEADEDISAFCWTNVRFTENKCGVWKDIQLHENPKCRTEGPNGVCTHVFQGYLAPAIDDCYRITFNVKWKKFMVWANDFQMDNMLYVTPGGMRGGEINVNVPVNFPCDNDIGYGDTRCVTMPSPAGYQSSTKFTSSTTRQHGTISAMQNAGDVSGGTGEAGVTSGRNSIQWTASGQPMHETAQLSRDVSGSDINQAVSASHGETEAEMGEGEVGGQEEGGQEEGGQEEVEGQEEIEGQEEVEGQDEGEPKAEIAIENQLKEPAEQDLELLVML